MICENCGNETAGIIELCCDDCSASIGYYDENNELSPHPEVLQIMHIVEDYWQRLTESGEIGESQSDLIKMLVKKFLDRYPHLKQESALDFRHLERGLSSSWRSQES